MFFNNSNLSFGLSAAALLLLAAARSRGTDYIFWFVWQFVGLSHFRYVGHESYSMATASQTSWPFRFLICRRSSVTGIN